MRDTVREDKTLKFEVPEPCGKRPYQRRRNKNASGDCSWHARTRKLQLLGKDIFEWPRWNGAFGNKANQAVTS